jgi:hypothetical protein
MKNFTPTEDETICSAYFNVSMDLIVGVNQTIKCYSVSSTMRIRRLQILGLQVLCNTSGLISKRIPYFVVSMQKSKGGIKVGRARMIR